jgi:MerR family transcriptional regulator/heat shock protein HspR
MAARGRQDQSSAPSAGDGERGARGGVARDGRGHDRSRRVAAERGRGVYMISIAAELAGMHPQTLRIYESRGLIRPKRSPKNTRLYSQEDVERLRWIQELTNELGLNLAGVERVLALERELERVREEAKQAVERARRAERRELVRYEPPERALVPVRRVR